MKVKKETKQFLVLTENEHLKLLEALDISQSFDIRKVRIYFIHGESKVYDNNYVELDVKLKGD